MSPIVNLFGGAVFLLLDGKVFIVSRRGIKPSPGVTGLFGHISPRQELQPLERTSCLRVGNVCAASVFSILSSES